MTITEETVEVLELLIKQLRVFSLSAHERADELLDADPDADVKYHRGKGQAFYEAISLLEDVKSTDFIETLRKLDSI